MPLDIECNVFDSDVCLSPLIIAQSILTLMYLVHGPCYELNKLAEIQRYTWKDQKQKKAVTDLWLLL